MSATWMSKQIIEGVDLDVWLPLLMHDVANVQLTVTAVVQGEVDGWVIKEVDA